MLLQHLNISFPLSYLISFYVLEEIAFFLQVLEALPILVPYIHFDKVIVVPVIKDFSSITKVKQSDE